MPVTDGYYKNSLSCIYRLNRILWVGFFLGFVARMKLYFGARRANVKNRYTYEPIEKFRSFNPLTEFFDRRSALDWYS